jgi:hypothetical protein
MLDNKIISNDKYGGEGTWIKDSELWISIREKTFINSNRYS